MAGLGLQSGASRASTLRRTDRKSPKTGVDSKHGDDEEESGLFSSKGLPTSTPSEHRNLGDQPHHETADQLAFLQQRVLDQHLHGPHIDHEVDSLLPLAPEEETLKQVCFRPESEALKLKKEGPKLPVELGHLPPLKAVEEARKLSAGNAHKVLEADIKWTQAYLYCQPQKGTIWKKMTLNPKSDAVQKFKEEISSALMKTISKLSSFALLDYPARQEELSEKEIQQMLRIIIYLHKSKLAEPEDSAYKSPSPVEVLPRFVRGQCEIVELKAGSFYDRFQDLQGNAYPFVFPEGTMSVQHHAVSTTESSEMDSRVTLEMPQKAYAIQGHVAQRLVIRPGESEIQVAGKLGEKQIILTAETSKNAMLKSIESDADDPRLAKGVPQARESETQLKKDFDELSTKFLTEWKQFQADIDSFDHGTELFKNITKAIEQQARQSPKSQISERDICEIIEFQCEKHTKALGRASFSEREKISILVNYQALVAAQRVSIKPFIASGFALAGDILHLVPGVGYGSLAFAGISFLMEYAEERKHHVTVVQHQTLSRAINVNDLSKVNHDQKWWQKLSLDNHKYSDSQWWRELKAAGPARIGFEVVKFLPAVGKAATILSIVIEMRLIQEKMHTYKAAVRGREVESASKSYKAVRAQNLSFMPSDDSGHAHPESGYQETIV